MKKVKLYLKPTCPFCKKAILVLNRQGVKPNTIDISNNPSARRAMIQAANGRTTVPQIFIDETHVGGCDDLVKLEASGELRKLLEND